MKTILQYIILSILLLSTGNVNSQDYFIVKGDTTYIDSDSVYLYVGDHRGQIKWQVSTDSISWENIPNAYNDSVLVLVDSTLLYRASITENTCNPIYSDTILVHEDRKTELSLNAYIFTNDSIDISSDSTYLTFTYTDSISDSIKTGQIIFSSVGDGILKKVIGTTIDTSSMTVEVETANTSLTEVFSDLYVIHSDTIKNDASEPYIVSKGVSLIPIEQDQLDLMRFDLAIVLYDKDNNYNTKDDQVRIAGEYKLTPRLDTEIKIRGGELKKLYLEYEFDNYFDLTLEISSGINTGDLFVKELFAKPKRLGKIVIPTAVGVPIILIPELQVEVGAKLGIRSQVATGLVHQSTSKTSMLYQYGKWTTNKSKTKKTEFVLPEIEELSAYAKAFVKPEIAVKIYSLLGPYANIEVYSELDVSPVRDPWWEFYIGASMGMGAKMDIFSKSVFDFSFQVFDYKTVLAHAPTASNFAPIATCVVSPQDGLPGTLFNFNTLESSDKEDNTIDLKVRWDWDNDGKWDTPYSTQKIASYRFEEVGEHIITVEVLDTDGNATMAQTSISIINESTEAPVARFSYYTTGTEKEYRFNASGSYDPDGRDDDLLFAWDFDNDNTLEQDYSKNFKILYEFPNYGSYSVVLHVKDADNNISKTTKSVSVKRPDISIVSGTVSDIDGNVYKTVKIGEQWWMAENMRTTKYPNGVDIPYVASEDAWKNLGRDNTSDAYYDFKNNDSYVEEYGYYYTYAAAIADNWTNDNKELQGICPNGWHLPSLEEWLELRDYIASYGYNGDEIEDALKSSQGWRPDYHNGTNQFGFNMLPAGNHYGQNYINGEGSMAFLWSSTDFLDSGVDYRNDSFIRWENGTPKNWGNPIRCIKD